MATTRYIEVYNDQGHIIDREPYEVNDEQLEDEAEAVEIEKLKAILDKDWTARQAQKVLKLLIRRLMRKGILP